MADRRKPKAAIFRSSAPTPRPKSATPTRGIPSGERPSAPKSARPGGQLTAQPIGTPTPVRGSGRTLQPVGPTSPVSQAGGRPGKPMAPAKGLRRRGGAPLSDIRAGGPKPPKIGAPTKVAMPKAAKKKRRGVKSRATPPRRG